MAEGWDQSVFDSTLKEFLHRQDSSTWPRTINKKGLYIALAAMQETPRTAPEKIISELSKEVFTRQGGGPSRQVTLGYALAAHRASKNWLKSGRYRAAARKAFRESAPQLIAEAWEKQVQASYNKMLGSRKAASGFIKAGWLSVIQKLGPIIGGKYNRGSGGARIRGQPKGTVSPAKSGNLQLTMENTAQARSDKRGGLVRFGTPPLQQAYEREMSKMQETFDEESKEDFAWFNKMQH